MNTSNGWHVNSGEIGKIEQTRNIREMLIFIICAYSISWLIWLPLVLNDQLSLAIFTLPFQHFLGAFGPMIAALITVLRFKGRVGIKDFLSRAFKIKIG
ncbi:MAG: hypothetical protein AB1633_10040, partial [Elusimicrobiota bacterium]